MSAKVIGIVQEKGGVGKSATCIQTAYLLQSMGNKVCIIDNDPQTTSMQHSNKTDAEIRIPTIPIARPLQATDLTALKSAYDYILIDGRGNMDHDERLESANNYLSELSEDARLPQELREEINDKLIEIFGPSKEVRAAIIQIIKVSDFVVIPWTPAIVDVKGGIAVIKAVRAIYEDSYKKRYGLLATKFQRGTTIFRLLTERIKDQGLVLFESGFAQRTSWAQLSDRNSFAYEPAMDVEALKQLKLFVDELLTKVEGH